MDNFISFVNNTSQNDELLLDAYSKTITGVVGKVAGSVAHIQIEKQVRNPKTNQIQSMPASGSGFVISSDMW